MVAGIDIDKDKHHAFMGMATGKSLFKNSFLKTTETLFTVAEDR